MKSIAVYCGSSSGNNPLFTSMAVELGTLLVSEKISLVYGGAKVGLMGVIADAVLNAGGNIVGVLPRFISRKEIAHDRLSELILCETMHERKQIMYEMADGFIALPGGFGTLDELFEILTWQQLGLHQKPIGILNVDGFYNALKSLFGTMESAQILKSENRSMALFEDDPQRLLRLMKDYRPQAVPKWLDISKT